jgi:hypothetical protein
VRLSDGGGFESEASDLDPTAEDAIVRLADSRRRCEAADGGARRRSRRCGTGLCWGAQPRAQAALGRSASGGEFN